MRATRVTWAALVAVYLAFFAWYTSFDGPLGPDEVERYVALMAEQNPDATPEQRAALRAFLAADTGDDFVMWNTIEMRATPLAVDGVDPGDTSDEVIGRYMQYMWPALLGRACHPVFLAAAAAPALEMFGMSEGRTWTRGAGMRYRSRRDMMDIATNPAFHGAHQFKIASMEKTFAFPGDPWFHLGDPRLLLGLVLLPVGLLVQLVAGRGPSRR